MSAIVPPCRRILLIGWDAADWQHIDPLLEEGLMPALQGLITRGVRGNLASLMPMVSPMLWTTIATGKTADRHGVHGFVEPNPENGGARPWSCLSRQGKTIWNILHQQGWRCSTVGWWASHPAEPLNGVVVSNVFSGTRRNAATGEWRVPAGSVHPAEAAARMAPRRMMPQEVTREHILPFIPRAAEIDQDKDRRLENFAGVLSSTVTIQALATEIMEHEPWDFSAVYFDGVDHFCHGFMPFHPPRLAHVPEHEFEIYKDVVRGAYRFHDMMLERLLQLAGPDTTIVLCSDHGFLSGSNRPLADPNDPAGPTLWHRDMGFLVMAGPGIAEGKRVYGATLLDITPTLLTLCGLPCGIDMSGKPLLDSLTGVSLSNLPARIPSWDDVPGNDGRHPPGTRYLAGDADTVDLTRQLAALGYVEDNGDDKEKAAAAAACEAAYNLAQVHLSNNRPGPALPLLEDLLEKRPWETRIVHQLAHALTRAGFHRQGIDLLLAAYPESDPEMPLPAVLLILARARLGLGDRDGAWFYATRAARSFPMLSGAYIELADLCMDIGKLAAAEHAARRAIALDDTSAAAWETLAAIHLRRHEDEAALTAGLAAVERIWQIGRAHFIIGLALARLGRFPEARIALERATVMLPQHPGPWRVLAVLPNGGGDGAFVRDACRMRARLLSREAAVQGEARRIRAREPRAFPPLPPPAERRAIINAARPPAATVQTPALSGKVFTLVSGLPRSGTSLMMQMLAAGGLPPRTDGERAADDDNPEGYLEWEALKRIAAEPQLFDEQGLDRFAIKCVTAHLTRLPAQHRYRIVFMTRPVAEIARSQQRMIDRRGTSGMDGTLTEIAAALQRHRDETLSHLRGHPRAFDVLMVDYPSLVADPAPWIENLAAFLGPELLPHPDHMAAAVRPALHRQKSD